MSTLVTVIHVITCVLIVLSVLINSGKGAEISATLGGSSQTVFGSSGGANFFTKLTFALAFIFMVTSLGLTIISNNERKSVFETTGLQGSAQPSAPTAPASPTASSANAETSSATTQSTPQTTPKSK